MLTRATDPEGGRRDREAAPRVRAQVPRVPGETAEGEDGPALLVCRVLHDAARRKPGAIAACAERGDRADPARSILRQI